MSTALKLIDKASPAALRHDLRGEPVPEILLRRAIVGASLIGIGCMAIVTLYQSGLLRHLADPPLDGFDSDKVNASDTAYGWGMPDAPLSIASHAASIALATYGTAERHEKQPLVPLAATLAAAPAALTSAQYLFYQMPVKEKGWCPYCIVDALAHISALGLGLWESSRALVRLARR
jgi:uncharacterized membrane protein